MGGIKSFLRTACIEAWLHRPLRPSDLKRDSRGVYVRFNSLWLRDNFLSGSSHLNSTIMSMSDWAAAEITAACKTVVS